MTDQFDLLKSHIEAYTRKDGAVVQAHDDKRVAAPPITTHAAALRASSTRDDMDHEDNQIAAGYMEEGDHKSLAGHIKHLDTAARDHILDHVHPAHREGLGFKQIDMKRSMRDYEKQFPANKANSGSEERKNYGDHFKKGDKVKDRYGKTHEVAEHVGPDVRTTGGEHFHPTKLFRN